MLVDAGTSGGAHLRCIGTRPGCARQIPCRHELCFACRHPLDLRLRSHDVLITLKDVTGSEFGSQAVKSSVSDGQGRKTLSV